MKNILFIGASNQDSGVGAIMQFLFLLGFIVIVFILLRQVVLWYWKVNSIEKLLIEQNELLKQIRDKEIK